MSYPAIVFTAEAGSGWINAINRMMNWTVDLYPNPGTPLAETANEKGAILAQIVWAYRHDKTGTPVIAFLRLTIDAESKVTSSNTAEVISDEDLDRIEVH